MDRPMASRSRSREDAARGLGRMLRAQHDGLMREPLPARWIELINCLDEKERARLKSELHLASEDGAHTLKS